MEIEDQPTGAKSLDRALDLFTTVLRDRGRTPLSDLARRHGMPISTAHRLLAAFERQRLLVRGARGRYVAGMGLAELAADRRSTLIAASRPLLRRLARARRSTAHLGVLEADMVTYLVKEHGGGAPVFTREMMQLEAYCTGIGKVLLAGLDAAAQARYLAGGPFVALTPQTLTDPALLAQALAEVAARGHAIDNAEMAESVHCVAAPIHDPQGRTIAAISLSSADADPARTGALIQPLRDCAAAIEAKLFGG